ncbi:hypothetical protein MAR_003254 [Mya arenaria]|uniref:Uncharacterized protein n=1 Tax=Mya arenaria TaxID=6604 RepID=A0ABY7G9J7_MYAAR|nr:hypothetical protein MAR_003254 [Mya arenaria]
MVVTCWLPDLISMVLLAGCPTSIAWCNCWLPDLTSMLALGTHGYTAIEEMNASGLTMATDPNLCDVEQSITEFFSSMGKILNFCESNEASFDAGIVDFGLEEIKMTVCTLTSIKSLLGNEDETLKCEMSQLLSSFISLQVLMSEISRMFLVRRTTFWRRLKSESVNFNRYSNINDDTLKHVMKDIQKAHPHCGVAMMMGHLRSRGLYLHQHRVREALRSLNPASSVLRWGLVAKRR